MKSILKDKTLRVTQLEMQSHSIGAVRWTLPEADVQVHSSAPSGPFKCSSITTARSQQRQHQQSLKDLRSLQECIKFINHWKEQVAQVCKEGKDAGEGCSRWAGEQADPKTERSLEESRKLILQWANELQSVDKLSKDHPWMTERFDQEANEDTKHDVDPDEVVEKRIMEWAKELQSVSESCGVLGDDLAQMLGLLGLKKKRLICLMPLLEFITWSLLKEDSKSIVPHLWLSAKQRTWKAGISRYIPNSEHRYFEESRQRKSKGIHSLHEHKSNVVWSWIISAAADVTLDPMTNHPWLQLSDDQKKVQEGLREADLPYSPQRFDGWPCVLGWEGYTSGRHYWELNIANNGYWKVGVTTSSSKRHGRFQMIPSNGYWALWRSTRQFFACTNQETTLPPTLVPRKMGIYIDYEEGQISFYNAESKSHIYTFTGNFSEKLYPFFAPLDGRTLITIWSPKETSNQSRQT